MGRQRARRAARLTAEDELALLLCATRAHRAAHADRIADLAREVHYGRLGGLLSWLKVLQLAGTRLREYTDVPPPGFRAAVDAAVQRVHLRALFYEAANTAVLDALEAQGIRALPMKGPVLAQAIHPQPGLRDCSDLDVLVPADDLRRAVDVVRTLGYDMPKDLARHGDLPELHYELHHPEGRLPPVELHWRIHWFEQRFSHDMLARSTHDGGPRRAQPTDEFAALLLFYARDGFTGLRLLADIAAWWDRYGDDGFDAGAFAALLDAYPEVRRACLAGGAVVERLAAVNAGPAVAERADRRTSLAARLANWNLSGEADQIMANLTLVDGLLAPAGTLTDFARRHLLLPEDRLDQFYRLPPDAGLRRVMWKVVHPPKVLLRYVFALATLLRRRSWSAAGSPG
jgi:hypothetical protein